MEVEIPVQQGWLCPRCGRINAPWLPACDCTPMDKEEDKESTQKKEILYKLP